MAFLDGKNHVIEYQKFYQDPNNHYPIYGKTLRARVFISTYVYCLAIGAGGVLYMTGALIFKYGKKT